MSINDKPKRLINYIVDLFIILIIAFLIDFNSGMRYSNASFFIVFFSYYFFFELLTQKTIGKYLTNTEVVDMDGKKPTITKILIKTFCRLLHFDVLSFWLGPYGLHDGYSKTKTISKV